MIFLLSRDVLYEPLPLSEDSSDDEEEGLASFQSELV